MPWTSIHEAHEYWRLNRRRPEPPSDLDDVEAFILTAPPHTIEDAACILDVIIANEGDVRIDELDRSALKCVRSLLGAEA